MSSSTSIYIGNRKPFNLNEALAGAKVVTRNGKPVTEFKLFSLVDDSETQPLRVVVGGYIEAYTAEGKYYASATESEYDLFMEVKTATKWINVYKTWVSGPFESKSAALTAISATDALNNGEPLEITYLDSTAY